MARNPNETAAEQLERRRRNRDRKRRLGDIEGAARTTEKIQATKARNRAALAGVPPPPTTDSIGVFPSLTDEQIAAQNAQHTRPDATTRSSVDILKQQPPNPVGNFGQLGPVGYDTQGNTIYGNVGPGTRDVSDPTGGPSLVGGTAYLPEQVGQIDLSQFGDPLTEHTKSVASRVGNIEGPAPQIQGPDLGRTSVLGAAPQVGRGPGDPNIQIARTGIGAAPQVGAGLGDPNIQVGGVQAGRAGQARGGTAQTQAASDALLESLNVSRDAFGRRAALGAGVTQGLADFIGTGDVPAAFQNTLGAQYDDAALAGEAERQAILARTGARGSQLDRELAASLRAEGTETSRFRGEQNKELFDLAAQLGITAPETFGAEARATAEALGQIGSQDFTRSAFNVGQEQAVNLAQFEGDLRRSLAQGEIDQSTFNALMTDKRAELAQQAQIEAQFATTQFEGDLQTAIEQGRTDQRTFFGILENSTARDLANLDERSRYQMAQFAANEGRDLARFDQGNLNAREQAELADRAQARQLQREQIKATIRLAEREMEEAEALARQGQITEAEMFNIRMNFQNALSKGQLFNQYVTNIESTRAGERTADKASQGAMGSALGSLAGIGGALALNAIVPGLGTVAAPVFQDTAGNFLNR